MAAALARHGGRVINADLLGHEALRQPEVRQRIVERWGKELLDDQGQIVRRRLAAIVFRDPAELRALEEIVHPWIGQAIREEIARHQADPAVRFLVLDAAVMLSWLAYRLPAVAVCRCASGGPLAAAGPAARLVRPAGAGPGKCPAALD